MIEATAIWIRRHSHVNWALIDQTMVSGVNFLTGILLARYLGIEEFGRFTLVWMVILFVQSIQHAALHSPMMSIGPKQRDADSPAYFGAIFIHLFVFVSIVSISLFIGIQWVESVFPEWHMEGLGSPLALATFAVLLQDFLRRYFFTKGQSVQALTNDSFRYLGQIAILIGLFVFFESSMDTANVLWVIAIIALAATVHGAFFIGKVEVNIPTLREVTQRHWHFSKWLTPSAMMNWTTGNLFILVAGMFLGTLAVGALKAAQSLMGIVHIIFMGLENVVPIRAAKYFHEEGKDALRGYLKRTAVIGGGVTAVIALVAAMMPEFWLNLVFGQEYQGYGFLLQWYAANYLLIFLSFPLRSGLRAIEQPKAVFWTYIWMTAYSLIAVYPMVKSFGLTGVMLGIVIANLIQVLGQWYFLNRTFTAHSH
jgi:O-antigen/teichoic acid export membrane protein